MPLTIAEQLGYFKAEGVAVDIINFADGSRAVQALADGAARVVSGLYEDTVSQQARGQPTQAFVLQSRAPAISMGISPKTMPRYRKVTDLRGKKIGVLAASPVTRRMASLILARAGLSDTDVGFVSINRAADAQYALRAGQIDAICHGEPVMTMLEQRGEIRIIADTRTLKGTQDVFGGAMPAGCLYAPLQFIQKNRDAVQALTNAMVRGLKWLQTAGPGDIIRTVPEAYLLGDRAVYLASFNKLREAISPDGVMPDDGPRNVLRALAGFDASIKPEQIVLARTYTNEFAKKAGERFKA